MANAPETELPQTWRDLLVRLQYKLRRLLEKHNPDVAVPGQPKGPYLDLSVRQRRKVQRRLLLDFGGWPTWAELLEEHLSRPATEGDDGSASDIFFPEPFDGEGEAEGAVDKAAPAGAASASGTEILDGEELAPPTLPGWTAWPRLPDEVRNRFLLKSLHHREIDAGQFVLLAITHLEQTGEAAGAAALQELQGNEAGMLEYIRFLYT